ncbi:MAG: glycosyltransferase [Gammaproteobacteria bacterium]|nr:glycosyltransferase [Gammaproteobacteria bacterium]
MPKPIGVLTTSYPRHDEDGAGTFVRGFCVACAAAGLPVEVLCPETESGQRLADPGVTVTRLSYWRPRSAQFLSQSPGAPDALADRPWLWAPGLAFSARLLMAVAARRRTYRALVSHWLLPCGIAGALATGVPHLAIAHGSDVRQLRRLPGGDRLVRWLLGRGTFFAFVSEALRGQLGELLPSAEQDLLYKRSVVQPVGVDVASLNGCDRATVRKQLGLRGPVALWLGRMVPVKCPGRVIELARALPEVTVLIAGAGPLEDELRRAAAPLGDRVRFFGWVGSRTRAELLAAADALVIPSTVLEDGRSEGQPVVAREALAAGLPVVATPVGGLVELPALSSAVHLAADERVRSLELATRAALTHGRLPEAARSRLAADLDWSGVLPRLLAALEL